MSMSASNNTNTAMTTYSELKQSKQLLNLLQPELCIGQILRSLPLYYLIEYRNVCNQWIDLIEDICHFQKTLILRFSEEEIWFDNVELDCQRTILYEPQHAQDLKTHRNSTLHMTSLDAFIVNTLINLFPRLQKLTIIVGKISKNQNEVFAQLVRLLTVFAPKLISFQVVIIELVPEQHFLSVIKVINSSMSKLKRLFIYYNSYFKSLFEMPVLGQLEQFDLASFSNKFNNLFNLWEPVLEKRCKLDVNTNSKSSSCLLPPLTLNLKMNLSTDFFPNADVAATINSLNSVSMIYPENVTPFCNTFNNLTILEISITRYISYPFLIEQLANLKKLIKFGLSLSHRNWEQYNIIGSELNPDQQLSTVLPTIKTLKLSWRCPAINHNIFSSWQLTTVFPNVATLKMTFSTESFACTACDWKIDLHTHPDRSLMALNLKEYLKRPKCFYSEKQQEINQLDKYEMIKLHIYSIYSFQKERDPSIYFSKTKYSQQLCLENLFIG